MTPQELFEQNQRLVYYCLKGIPCPPMWIEDLKQEGLLELWRVAQRFNPELGYSFSTYAVPSIRGAMQRFARDKMSTIRIPRSMWDDGTYADVQIMSLNSTIRDHTNAESDTEFAGLIPGEEDFYPNIFEDTLDDFLETIPPGRYRDVAEEFMYGCAYGESPNQSYLAEKYNCSQAQISRYRRQMLADYQRFLNSIDKGDTYYV